MSLTLKTNTERDPVLNLADLGNGLIKVGLCTDGRLDKRLQELRRQFGPHVEIFESAPVPKRWGTAQDWELRFKEMQSLCRAASCATR